MAIALSDLTETHINYVERNPARGHNGAWAATTRLTGYRSLPRKPKDRRTRASRPAFRGGCDAIGGSVRSASRAALPTCQAAARAFRNVMISDCNAAAALFRSES